MSSLKLSGSARWPLSTLDMGASGSLLIMMVMGSCPAQGQQCGEGTRVSCYSDADCSDVNRTWVCATDSEEGQRGHCTAVCSRDADTNGKGAAACSLGETCVDGASPRGEPHTSCQASKFSVDLNLLDTCIYQFFEGAIPDLDGSQSCALEDRLQHLLDRDGNGNFNIYDVDRCITDFLDEEPCDAATSLCPGNQVFCRSDDECGEGLHCNTDLLRCERECGLLRTLDGKTLERECAGALQICDYTRGQCVEADLTKLTCEVDRECPHGAYCLAGRCEPKCARSLDCPGDGWVCNAENRCAPKPVNAGAGTEFAPGDYSLVFDGSEVRLDSINDHAEIPVIVTNELIKKQVVNRPEVVFGYRLEVTYEKTLVDEQQFIRLDSPFGVLSVQDFPAIGISLNPQATRKLPEGTHAAKLTAIFDNGAMASTRVTFQKSSPNGEYVGRLSVYVDVPSNLIGNTQFGMRIFVDRKVPDVKWEDLLKKNGLPLEQEYRDLNQGKPVMGVLHGAGSLVFDWPLAEKLKDDEIPVKGIYSEASKRMRLVAVVDMRAEHCRSDNAARCVEGTGELQARNPFGRSIRRIIEFVGPFDGERRRFEGMYRETLHGLLPNAATLSGGFLMGQVAHNDDPLTLNAPLLAANAPSISFPTTDTLMQELGGVIRRSCPSEAASYFNDQRSFSRYLTSDWSESSGRPVFHSVVTFQKRVKNALDTLGGAQGALTLMDYFRGQIEFCEPGGAETCVDQRKLECGLALYRKALLGGWVGLDQVGREVENSPLSTKPPLFCQRAPGVDTGFGSDCPLGPATAPGLVTLQEHNRFYKELTQTYSFQALNGLSDAFYTLYKAENGDALDGDSAFQHRQASLARAARSYQLALEAALSPASVGVMIHWPMGEFATGGSTWIKQMQASARDRLEAVVQLIDVKRRILQDFDGADTMFAEDLLQQEYLVQVFLALLQQRWEGTSFAYAGQGPQALEQGGILLAKANASRNPLGLHPNRVYFENSDLQVSNWQALRGRVQEGSVKLHGTVDAAIAELKNALRDKGSFLATLGDVERETGAQIAELCGDENVTAGGRVIKFNGGNRPCNRGRLGALLDERGALELNRQHALAQFSRARAQVSRHQAYLSEVKAIDTELASRVGEFNDRLRAVEGKIHAAQGVKEAAMELADVADCLIIVGVAGGTNCIGKAVAAGLKSAIVGVGAAANVGFQTERAQLEQDKELLFRGIDAKKELAQLRLGLDDMIAEVETALLQADLLTRQIYNLDLQVADTHYLAQAAANRYQEKLGDLVDHLVGTEAGSVLLRNRLMRSADQQFQTLLLDTYKMTQGFVHRYNQAERKHALLNATYQLSSVVDIDAHTDRLVEIERDYCGAEGIDCDARHNRGVLEFSLRQNLFPNLRDIVDASTGTVLSAGQQFHQLLTTQMTRRRQRASGVREQIELPFNIWLNRGGLTGGRDVPYLVNGEECNHVLVADRQSDKGTIAVNAVGTRLGPANRQIKYEIWRGGTDHLRSCSERVSPVESKINSYTVGWSPYHRFGALDEPPTFQTHSEAFVACKNDRRLADSPQSATECFNFFARDRSLAAPDWKLVIPIDQEQSWLRGEGLNEHERPVLEDIVIYFRYNARPIVSE